MSSNLKFHIEQNHYESGDVKMFIEANFPVKFISVSEVNKCIEIVRKCELDESTRKLLIEELNEIKADIKFVAVKSNRIIMYIDEHGKVLENMISKIYKVKNLMVRSHVSKKYLCILGETGDDPHDIEKYVESQSGFKAKFVHCQ